MQDVAVLDDVVLAFGAQLSGVTRALFAAIFDEAVIVDGLYRMKPRSKSPWMTPAASGALAPRRTVQARASLGPTVK